MFAVLYNTGARVSEVTGLHVANVVLDGSPCVHIHGKGRKQRTVPLSGSTAALVRAWKRQLGNLADTASLFPNQRGTAMTRSNVTQRPISGLGPAAAKASKMLKPVNRRRCS